MAGMRSARPGVLLLAGLALMAPVPAEERPLPELGTFLAETRKRLQTDESAQRDYVYVETRRDVKLDARGQPTEESIKVFESYPGLPGEEGRWERLVAVDGRPVPRRQLDEQDRERRAAVEALASRMARNPERERERQARERDKRRQEMDAAVADVFRVYDVRLTGRARVGGHDTIVVTLTPRADASPRTREGRIMGHFAVRAWISEHAHELVRVDAEAIRTLSFGFGILARIHEGSELSFERREVDGGSWLPASSSYTGSARVGLVRMLRRSRTSEYSDYRRFTVETLTSYLPADR